MKRQNPPSASFCEGCGTSRGWEIGHGLPVGLAAGVVQLSREGPRGQPLVRPAGTAVPGQHRGGGSAPPYRVSRTAVPGQPAARALRRRPLRAAALSRAPFPPRRGARGRSRLPAPQPQPRGERRPLGHGGAAAAVRPGSGRQTEPSAASSAVRHLAWLQPQARGTRFGFQ